MEKLRKPGGFMAREQSSDFIKPNEHKLPFRVLVAELRIRRPILADEEELRKKVAPGDLKLIDSKKNDLETAAAADQTALSNKLSQLKDELRAAAIQGKAPEGNSESAEEYLGTLEKYYKVFNQHPLPLSAALDAIDNAHDQLDAAKKNLIPDPPDESWIRALPENVWSVVTVQRAQLRDAAGDAAKLHAVIEAVEKQVKEISGSTGDAKAKLSDDNKQIAIRAIRYYQAVAKYKQAAAAVQNAEAPLKKLLHAAKLNALCFSGGGIRSACFSLGVFTELARISASAQAQDDIPRGVLGSIDYISTVSGGGYTGSWLTAWTRRHADGFAGIIRDLAGLPPTSVDPEPAPLRHLRDYTSYLAPHQGMFSVDSWTLAAIFLRNLLLNWTILIPLFAAVLLVPLFNALTFRGLATSDFTDPNCILLGAAIISALWSFAYIAWQMPGNREVQPEKIHFILNGWLPLLISAWSISAYWLVRYQHGGTEWTKYLHDHFSWFWLVAFIAEAGSVLVRFIGKSPSREYKRNSWLLLAYAVINSAFIAWLLWLLATKLAPDLADQSDNFYLFTVAAVPLVWVAFMLAIVVMNGMSAQLDAEENREWWSRSTAIMMIGLAGWLVFHSLVLYSWPVAQAFQSLSGDTIPPTATVGLLATILGGVASFLGYSPATPGNKARLDTEKLGKISQFLAKRELLIPALGTLFFVILAIALADLNYLAIRWIGDTWFPSCTKFWQQVYSALIEAAVLGAIAVGANLVVNVNTFSLHGMYRMRLIRSYLGASNTARKPNPFINFDPTDNMAMQDAVKSAKAPLHVINMALNLVAGKKLAWQQRKAESFTVTALHAGSYRSGYLPTGEYAGTKGMTLGTAMAISGAAASPNMGYHSSPILTLVMALFNARLGWWLPNTNAGKEICKKNSPSFSIKPLIYESFGRTTDEQPWIYLSDGGHFENLGLYEMVMRRCNTIVVVDGSADSGFTFEDLGNALRKICIDFGIPIDFSPSVSLIPGPDKTNHHCFVGDIKYGCVDKDAASGTLIYIKASLNGNEPADVTEYYKGHNEFPHEPTSNQFFNEAQFESYLRLGSHIVHEIVEPAGGAAVNPLLGLEQFVKAAQAHANK
jgi:hypothetical protein